MKSVSKLMTIKDAYGAEHSIYSIKFDHPNIDREPLLILNCLALLIILLLIFCTTHIFIVQPKPTNPSWTFQYNNSITFYALPLLHVAILTAMACRIIYRKFNSVICALSIIVVSYSVTLLEMFSRNSLTVKATIASVVNYYLHSYFMPQSILLPLLVFFLLQLITNSTFLSTLIMTVSYTVIALIDSGKMRFFHHHFYPADVSVALHEFISIAPDCFKEYLSTSWLIAIVLTTLICLISYMVTNKIHIHITARAQCLVIILVAIACSLYANLYNCYEKKQAGKRGFNYYHHSYDEYYSKGYFVGFISCFFYGTKTAMPEGYSKEKIDSIIDNIKCTPSDNDKAYVLPYIIVWQSESFEDLRKYPSLKIHSDVYKKYDKINTKSTHGYALSPNYYTINSQFEFETSFFYKYYMPEMIIYNKIHMKVNNALGYTLKKYGYNTASLQLYENTAFSAKVDGDSVYGIDESCVLPKTRKLFANTNRVSDIQYAETALAFIEKRVDQKRPAVLFVQTDQNHIPHNISEITKPDDIKAYKNHKIDDKLTAYSRGIYETGFALEWLTNKLSAMKVPVVLLFYGDHTASYGYSMINDKETESMTSLLRASTTSFFIWSNYKKSHKQLQTESLAFLGNELMNYIGLPLNRYQTFMEDYKRYSRGLGRDIILDEAGKQISNPNEQLSKKIKDQWLLEYDVITGDNYSGNRLADSCASN